MRELTSHVGFSEMMLSSPGDVFGFVFENGLFKNHKIMVRAVGCRWCVEQKYVGVHSANARNASQNAK